MVPYAYFFGKNWIIRFKLPVKLVIASFFSKSFYICSPQVKF